ncbi:hypothetical protein, partial [Actinomyces sp.]|uniref:hypothetical protein n=1 Tax=Actinomyces sp. TaxID=29317 RepID=UPI0026DD87FD
MPCIPDESGSSCVEYGGWRRGHLRLGAALGRERPRWDAALGMALATRRPEPDHWVRPFGVYYAPSA